MIDARRKACLEAMGIDLWLVRRTPAARALASEAGAQPGTAGEQPRLDVPGDTTSHLRSDVPRDTPAAGAAAPAALAAAVSSPPAAADPARLDWPGLEARVAGCTACPELAARRSRTVFGQGRYDADWLLIGDAPGVEDERQGEPIVGQAGRLLDNMLRAVGLARGQAYIANILKCRPPDSRELRPEEAVACRGFLDRQLALVQPRVVLVLGQIAAQNLLQTDAHLARLRGRLHRLGAQAIPVVVTYHPADLLRSPADKAKAWDDLRLALQASEGRLPEPDPNPDP